MARFDNYELSLSTASDEAAALYRDGIAFMLAAWPGAAENLDAAIEADPDFALAHAARARLHAMRAQPSEARARIAIAQDKATATLSEREASHVEVLALAINGKSQDALKAALAHVERWPRDTLVLSLPLGAFGLFAFSGMAEHNQAKVDLCERHAAHFADDDWWFLTYRGWALAENGEVAHGRAMLERAIELRRHNANCAHALAHAMFEAGANREAEALIAQWLPDYDRSGILHGHIAWHAALAALERGDVDTALAIYDGTVRHSVSLGTPINIVSDAASLLWRLQAYGHAVPEGLWEDAADYARRVFPKPGHAFVDPHIALLEAATGDSAALGRRIAALDELVANGAIGAGAIVPAIGRAALAFAEGDNAGCAHILEPMTMDFARIGGSNAQREVIEDTLLVALMRAGEAQKARALLDRRLHRRPSPRDTRWLTELAA
ncbi:tetratricopeptide repeat protein 38 family protein (plasmid) [Tardibacter chloracetimidivorans]|uniref:Tetratricopeptide repeat protein 38 n=2 Tax=Sphingomonadaceae TaxID=41297 RepID=A0A1L4A085_9SPHN|nr:MULTISPECIES: tetratricopeptide repeat protein [Sphingomonadaceae]API61286.1 tetratricopeptide repeat protein 38 family protein [Tardibacter chloracetimidivorans]MBB4151527.1 tetratricopeptide (TPR) repeat protein [Sphingobium scionense]